MSRAIINATLRWLVKRVNFIIPVRYHYTRFNIPIIRGLGVRHLKKAEPWMDELIEKLLSQGDDGIFIDVGVNIGQTLLKLRSVCPEIEYFGFEPNPACCYYVEQLVKVNRLARVSVFPVAIGNAPDIVSLYIHDSDDTSGSSGSLLKDFKARSIYLQKNIAVFPLIFFYERFLSRQVRFLKIDVEGAELEVLNGSMELIKSVEPIVSCELLPPINPATREETLNKKREIQKLMEAARYRSFKILKTAKEHFDGLQEVRDLAAETIKREG